MQLINVVKNDWIFQDPTITYQWFGHFLTDSQLVKNPKYL